MADHPSPRVGEGKRSVGYFSADPTGYRGRLSGSRQLIGQGG